MAAFVHCTDCQVWSDIPEGFRETKHFARCPTCSCAMYLARGIDPSEVGLREDQKVNATLMLHKDWKEK